MHAYYLKGLRQIDKTVRLTSQSPRLPSWSGSEEKERKKKKRKEEEKKKKKKKKRSKRTECTD